jgi:hypothetical protein
MLKESKEPADSGTHEKISRLMLRFSALKTVATQSLQTAEIRKT